MGNETKTPAGEQGKPLEGEGSALDIANAEERRIQLEGRLDPDNFQMPDGQTLSSVRQKLYETHVAEGDEANRIQLERVREQSMANDPIYSEGAKATMAGGTASILPGKVEEIPSAVGGDQRVTKSEVVASSPAPVREIPPHPSETSHS